MVYKYNPHSNKAFNMRTNGKYLTVKEVAAELQVHWQSVHNYIKRGQLQAFKVGNGYRVDPDALKRFMETRKVKPKGKKL